MSLSNSFYALCSFILLEILRRVAVAVSGASSQSSRAAGAAATLSHTGALAALAATAAADTEAAIVRGLKDQTQPGAWNAEGMKVAKRAAVALLMQLARPTLEALVPGGDAQALEQLAGAAIERAVAAASPPAPVAPPAVPV